MDKIKREAVKKYILENLDCTWEELYDKFGDFAHINAREFAGTVLSWTTIDLSNNKNLHPEIHIPRRWNS